MRFLILIILTINLAAAPAGTAGEDPLRCTVSIPPLAYFVDRIGGDRVEISVLISPGQSPETFEPTSKQLVDLSRSDIFFSIGAPFETVISSRIRDNFKTVGIVDISTGVNRLSLGDEPDPHLWLSPILMKTAAANISRALIEADPANQSLYKTGCAALISELDQADREIRTILEPVKGREIIVFHPSYGYFAEAYGLRQLSIEAEGTDPGPRHLAELINFAKSNKITTIFIQPQFSVAGARTVADEIGAGLKVLDPLSPDYLTNLVEMAKVIRKSFGI